jgi:hypothetical protein
MPYSPRVGATDLYLTISAHEQPERTGRASHQPAGMSPQHIDVGGADTVLLS